MIQPLLIGKQPLLHPVQHLQKRPRRKIYRRIAAENGGRHLPADPPNKKQPEADGGNQLPQRPKPEAEQDIPPRRGSSLDPLGQLSRSQLLTGLIIDPADLFQRQQLKIQIQPLVQLPVWIFLQIAEQISGGKHRAVNGKRARTHTAVRQAVDHALIAVRLIVGQKGDADPKQHEAGDLASVFSGHLPKLPISLVFLIFMVFLIFLIFSVLSDSSFAHLYAPFEISCPDRTNRFPSSCPLSPKKQYSRGCPFFPSVHP